MTTIPASTMSKVTKNLAGMPELLGNSLLGLAVAVDAAVTVAIVKTPHGRLLIDDRARERFWSSAC